MKIRSITFFCNPKYPLDHAILEGGAEFLRTARAALEDAGFDVQTTRIATIPFPKLLGERNAGKLTALAREVDQVIQQLDVGYICLGPALPHLPESYEAVPEAIAATKNVFFGGVMAERRGGINLAALRACARIITRCSAIEANGFANLRFAALANVPAGTPFFPAAYHEGHLTAFGIATEAADLAVEAFTSALTVEAGRKALITAIQKYAAILAKVSRAVVRTTMAAQRRAPIFLGIDFSLAPFPQEQRSLGTAFERMGVPRVGQHGSLAAAAILTECIDRARFPRAGFSGLFLPVLEDSTLAQRAAEGLLTVKDLLLYSAVCGTGLDTVPLPGEATEEQLGAVLLDLSALALRLDKPLTARLMPVPGRKAGDATGFDFAFFSNSKVMEMDSDGLRLPLGAQAILHLDHR